MKRIVVLLGATVALSGCMSMRDVGIGLQTGAAGAAGNGSGGVIVAPVLWVTGVALELAGNAVQSSEAPTEKQSELSPENR
ncbi:MAG: lipoprotein [Desulfobacter sp.]